MEWPPYLDEYEKLVNRMNTPRVVIDNAVCPTATLVKVDSARKRGILLEAIQVLTDLDLCIKKGYISSDGRWFMDVFHVTDLYDRKLVDDRVISYIEQSLSAITTTTRSPNPCSGLTALELTGTDRPGLLSEVFAVLADLGCSVAEARVWTHNGRIASLIYVHSEDFDPKTIRSVEARLRNVLKGDDDVLGGARTAVSVETVHMDRRLHRLMFEDRDYERVGLSATATCVSVQDWAERGYSVVNVQCRDRPKLLFDIVCTLTDMEYVVFHGTIDTDGDRAYQEFYIRHADGSPIRSEAERQRVIQCLKAAIERRASEGVKLELCTADRRGLLADVTRTFRENGLSVTLAEVSTKGDMAANIFYVTDAAGQPADLKAIDAVRQRIGASILTVKEDARPMPCSEASGGAGLFFLGSLVKRNLFNLGLIRSCS